MTSQMEKDLAKKADEKLVRVCLDALDLFRVGDVRPSIASFHLVESLLTLAAKLIVIFTSIPPEQAGKLFENMIVAYHDDFDKTEMKWRAEK